MCPADPGWGNAQFALDIAHAVVAEVADQPAIEARQAFDRRNAVALLEGLDEGQRVLDLAGLGLDAISGDADAVAPHAQHGAAWQADDRIAPHFAALNGFEQIGVRRIGQFQVQRQRRVEVGKGFERQGMRLWPSAAKRRNSSRVMSASWSEEGSNEQRQTRRPAGRKVRRASANGQGLDDFHPLSAGEHHELISSVGQKSPATLAQARNRSNQLAQVVEHQRRLLIRDGLAVVVAVGKRDTAYCRGLGSPYVVA